MTATAECPKCQGNGKIDAYAGIAGGVCFRCEGAGRIPEAEALRGQQAAERGAKRREAAQRRTRQKLEAKETAAAQTYGDHFRIAKALARFNDPRAVRAEQVRTEMRDGRRHEWVQEVGIRQVLPTLMKDLGVTGLSIEEIEAEAQASRQ